MSEQDNIPTQSQVDAPEQQPPIQQQQPAQQQPAVQQQPAQQQPVVQQQPVQQPYQQQWQQPVGQPAQQQWQQPQQTYQQPQQAYQPQQQAYQQPYQQQAQWQQPYQQPQGANSYAQPMPAAGAQVQNPATVKANNRALIALVCGIVAIITASSVVLGIGAGVAAIILGLKAKKETSDGKATAGFVCGIIGVALSVIMIPVLALYVIPLSQNGWNTFNSKAPTVTIADTISSEVVADDAVCTIKLSRMEIDKDGNLNVYFKLTNNSSADIDVYSKKGEPWELNGQKVECIAFSWAKSKETKEDFFTIPASYVDVSDVNEITSLSGTLVTELEKTRHEIEYRVDLYV